MLSQLTCPANTPVITRQIEEGVQEIEDIPPLLRIILHNALPGETIWPQTDHYLLLFTYRHAETISFDLRLLFDASRRPGVTSYGQVRSVKDTSMAGRRRNCAASVVRGDRYIDIPGSNYR